LKVISAGALVCRY